MANSVEAGATQMFGVKVGDKVTGGCVHLRIMFPESQAPALLAA